MNNFIGKCHHDDNCIYGKLGQVDGKPCYVCECGDCHQHFIIWLEEGDNEDIEGGEQGYKDFMESLI